MIYVAWLTLIGLSIYIGQWLLRQRNAHECNEHCCRGPSYTETRAAWGMKTTRPPEL